MKRTHLMEILYYFAYGSNMNPERMKERGAHFTQMEKYTLKGYGLRFNKCSSREPGRGCANIVPDERGVVEGVLYKITVEGLYNLDRYEGYPVEYGRVRFVIDLNGSQETLITYIVKPGKTKEGLYPSRSYIEHLLTAKDYLSEDYYKNLETLETIE